MAPLSASLAGVVLPHDHFGNYLDDQGLTINNDLELKNFGKACDVLVEIFNNLSIDNYPVYAHYRPPSHPVKNVDEVQ